MYHQIYIYIYINVWRKIEIELSVIENDKNVYQQENGQF